MPSLLLKWLFFTAVLVSVGSLALAFLLAFTPYSMPFFSVFHGLFFASMPFFAWAVYRKKGWALLALCCLFLVDKGLLLAFGMISPVLALPVVGLVGFLFLRGFLALRRYSGAVTFLPGKGGFVYKLKASFSFIFFVSFFWTVVSFLFRSWDIRFFQKDPWVFSGLLLVFFIGFIGFMFLCYRVFKLAWIALVFQLIGSLPMAVANLSTIAVATALTTVFPQHGSVPFQPLAFYVQSFGETLTKILFFFQIHTIFHSWWFVGLFVLLVLNVLRIAFKRSFNVQNLGFYLTHLSVVAIIISAWYNYFFSFHGIIPLVEGQVSDQVEFFDASQQKYGKQSVQLPFQVLLNRFETEPWRARYKVYIRKFPKDLPQTIPESVYKKMVQSLPESFRQSLDLAYVSVDKLFAHPTLVFLNYLGLSFLASYAKQGVEYRLRAETIDAQTQHRLQTIFKMFGYRAKDVAAMPIDVGQMEKILTTDISYKVLRYDQDYFYDYVPIPTRFENAIFQNQVIPLVSHPKDRQFLYDSYTLKGQFWELLKDLDLEQREKLAYLLNTLDRKALLEAVSLNTGGMLRPALGFSVHKGVGNPVRSWLSLSARNDVFESSDVNVFFFWDLPSGVVESRLRPKNVSPHILNVFRNDKQVAEIFLEEDGFYSLPDSEYGIAFSRYYNDFAWNTESGEYFNRSQEDKNPAVALEIVRPQEPDDGIPFVLFSKFNAIQTPQTLEAQKQSGYRFEYRYRPYRYTILVSGKDQVVYSSLDKSKILKQKLRLNAPYPLPGSPPSYLFFHHLFSDFKQVQVILQPQDNIPYGISIAEFDQLLLVAEPAQKTLLRSAYVHQGKRYALREEFFYDLNVRFDIARVLEDLNYDPVPNNPLIQLEIYKEGGYYRKLFLSSKGRDFRKTIPIPDSEYSITFESRADQETKFWKSHLVLLDRENNALPGESKAVVKVNDFMYYGGYRFYQTDAKKEDPRYSGIGVTKDPGLPFLYSSYVSLALGVFMMFYIPLGRRKK